MGISATIPKDPVRDQLDIHIVRKRNILSFTFFAFLLSSTTKKFRPTFCHFRFPLFAFWLSKLMHYQ